MRQRQDVVVESPEEMAEKNALFVKAAESLLRIALASLGGALVGISLARRNPAPLIQQVSTTVNTKHAMLGKNASNLDLPMRWAWSCVIFASIFESALWLSPTSKITENPYIQTIGNFTFGGTMAGSILRGLPVQRNRGSGAIVAPRMGAGIATGFVLGFVPGVIVAGLSMMEDKLKALDAVDQQTIAVGEAMPSGTINSSAIVAGLSTPEDNSQALDVVDQEMIAVGENKTSGTLNSRDIVAGSSMPDNNMQALDAVDQKVIVVGKTMATGALDSKTSEYIDGRSVESKGDVQTLISVDSQRKSDLS